MKDSLHPLVLVLVFALNLSSTVLQTGLKGSINSLHFARLNKMNFPSLLLFYNICSLPVLQVSLLCVSSNSNSSSLNVVLNFPDEVSEVLFTMSPVPSLSQKERTEVIIAQTTDAFVPVSLGCESRLNTYRPVLPCLNKCRKESESGVKVSQGE